MAQIREIKGSIFDSDCQVIVNTVNCKGFMGKGIALEFRYRYPEMFDEYKKQCDNNQIKIGQLTLWNKTNPWIINFPTKKDWKHPSKIEYIKNGLQYLVDHYKEWEINSIAIPRLGSNHGGLDWAEVRKIIHDYLKDLDLTLEIYEFDSRYPDKLFILLINKLKAMVLQDYVKHVGLGLKEAEILKEKVDENKIISFSDIQNLVGLGEKSLIKLYAFANKKSSFNQNKLNLQ